MEDWSLSSPDLNPMRNIWTVLARKLSNGGPIDETDHVSEKCGVSAHQRGRQAFNELPAPNCTVCRGRKAVRLVNW